MLEAARASFLAYGYSGTKMEIVAKDAGVSTATLYAAFTAKPELFRAVTRDSMRQLDGLFDAVERTGGDATVRLGVFALAYARAMAAPMTRALVRMVAAEQRQFPELAKTFLADSHQILGSKLRSMLTELRAQGRIEVEDIGFAARQLQGLIEHFTLFPGLFQGDASAPTHNLQTIAYEAVETFLARYGVRG